MSAETVRDELAALLAGHVIAYGEQAEGTRLWAFCRCDLDTEILGSDDHLAFVDNEWLTKAARAHALHVAQIIAEYVATKQAEAVREAADEIRRAQEEVGFPANHDRGVNYALMILDDRTDQIGVNS